MYRAIEGTLDNFVVELTKSIKFFQTRYPNTPVNGILLSGFGAIVPGFNEYVSSKVEVNVIVTITHGNKYGFRRRSNPTGTDCC